VYSPQPVFTEMAVRPIMTVDEVAEYLHCHSSTIYRLLKKGEIPGAFRVGGDWRVNSDKFHEWIERTTNIPK